MISKEIIDFIEWIEVERNSNWFFRVNNTASRYHAHWGVYFSVDVDYLKTEELFDFYKFGVKQGFNRTLDYDERHKIYNKWITTKNKN